MKNLTLENIARVCGGTYTGPEEKKEVCVSSITTDSRKVENGCLFVPIAGARADGHDYIEPVMNAGALATLSEKDLGPVDYPYIRVESSLQAVKDIAGFYLEQLQIPVVGITGSVGKTSTKEMIASVLEQKFRVLKTQGNFNNELGLPLTIFRLRDEDEIAVLEMGISDFGEMSRLAAVARPDIAVITNIGTCHLENLKDRDGVLRAKTEVFTYLKEDGHVILNGDDDKLRTVEAVNGSKPIFFGTDHGDDVYADRIENLGLEGMTCQIHMGEESFDAHTIIPGDHMIYNALAATAVGKTMGLTKEEIAKGILACVPISGRNHIIRKNNLVILDDCYNANPMSMKSGVRVLSEGKGRKVAILGDMGELGTDEKQLHYEVGAFAAAADIDVLLMTGELSREMQKGAQSVNSSVALYYFENREELLSQLDSIIKPEDTILVKASHFMGFEKVVEYLAKN